MEAVCIASGPSLTAGDCGHVRRWRETQQGRKVYVTNTTFRLCPWADVLYAMDRQWWELYLTEVDKTFNGRRVTMAGLAPKFGTERLGRPDFEHYNNSGAAAVALAIRDGATRIVMLGYDCQRTNGQTHWHGNHPPKLGNAGTLLKWSEHFGMLADAASKAGVTIINASRQTALQMFQRQELETACKI